MVGVHLAELGYCGVTEDALRTVVEKHVKTLLEQSEGQITYESLFPAVFGRSYQPKRQGSRGRLPRLQ